VTSSFFYPNNNSVTLSYLGDTNYAPNTSPATITLRNPAIGVNTPPTVGQSTTTLVPYTFVANGAININFNPQGAPSTDFTDGGTGTCQSGTQELAGTVCSLSVAFKPSLPGARKGAIEIDFTPAGGGAAEPTLYLFPYGMGDAAQISLSSAKQSVLNSSMSEPQSVAFSPTDSTNSTLYVANSNAKEIVTLPSSGGAFTQWNAANTADLVYPSDLAFDAFDDLVVSDANAAMVVLYTPAQVQKAVSTGTFTLGLPTAIKVDLGGNFYIADAGSTPRIIQVPGEHQLQSLCRRRKSQPDPGHRSQRHGHHDHCLAGSHRAVRLHRCIVRAQLARRHGLRPERRYVHHGQQPTRPHVAQHAYISEHSDHPGADDRAHQSFRHYAGWFRQHLCFRFERNSDQAVGQYWSAQLRR
jgi:hypothetical protein